MRSLQYLPYFEVATPATADLQLQEVVIFWAILVYNCFVVQVAAPLGDRMPASTASEDVA